MTKPKTYWVVCDKKGDVTPSLLENGNLRVFSKRKYADRCFEIRRGVAKQYGKLHLVAGESVKKCRIVIEEKQ